MDLDINKKHEQKTPTKSAQVPAHHFNPEPSSPSTPWCPAAQDHGASSSPSRTLTPEPSPCREIGLQGFTCDSCDISGPDRYHCNICQYIYCQACWNLQTPHKKGPANGQVNHEKTSLELAMRIEDSLRPRRSREEIARLHKADQIATWFGISRTEKGTRLIEEGRYELLLAQYPPNKRSELHPSLVSFIGQTGAGKSSLINLLITLHHQPLEEFDKPVVGAAGDSNTPTSGGVHLYQDPRSIRTSAPIFYADCEGLNGGNSEPLSQILASSSEPGALVPYYLGKAVQQTVAKIKGRLRKLRWLKDETRGRGFIVENMYSRILYTFSDVIVFVLENPRTIETVVLQLLRWASKVIETSTNQSYLPHAIIVLNMALPTLPDDNWDMKNATRFLFEGMDRDLENNVDFQEYIRAYRKRSNLPLNTQHMLQCYYTTVQVIRIPELADGAQRPNLINKQMKALYQQIRDMSRAVTKAKAESRMLLNADQFNPYIQLAFDHFSSEKGLDHPFDFVQASFSVSPVQADFANNIVTIAAFLLTRTNIQSKPTSLFTELGPLVASCIMFDTARNNRVGNADAIVPQYRHLITHDPKNDCSALQRIMDLHWPCKIPGCINVKTRHAAGHQSKVGKCLEATTPYKPADGLTAESYRPEFEKLILQSLQELLGDVQKQCQGGVISEAKQVQAVHQKNIRDFYKRHGPLGAVATFRDNSACLSCLIGMAAHPLACGHVICTACAQSFGQFCGPTVIRIRECPIHEHSDWKSWRLIPIQPKLAGIRILSMDGGGIRGISQLVILRQLEKALGGNIPIQCFFDLIVGTSIGGIIALGLFSSGWRVKEGLNKFKTLCKAAFIPRLRYAGLTDFLHWVQILTYRFGTTPLEEALKEAFTPGSYLFGGQASASAPNIFWHSKVAVTASTTLGGAVIFGNYNRFQPETLDYLFCREAQPDKGIKIWEAARATSAAPTWFDEFPHAGLNRRFLDGALYNNNPINIAAAEKKLIWPSCPIDVIASIGTGNEKQSEDQVIGYQEEKPIWIRRIKFPLRQWVQLGRIAVDHVSNALDSERTWRNFKGKLPSQQQDKCFRLNTALEIPVPELHEVEKIAELETFTDNYWAEDSQRQLIQQLASQLLASCFYFDVTERRETGDGSSLLIRGNILCRFSKESPHLELKHLGEHFRNCTKRSEAQRPRFRVDEPFPIRSQSFPVTDTMIEAMIQDENFVLTEEPLSVALGSGTASLDIAFHFGPEQSSWFSISGFPRAMGEGRPHRD